MFFSSWILNAEYRCMCEMRYCISASIWPKEDRWSWHNMQVNYDLQQHSIFFTVHVFSIVYTICIVVDNWMYSSILIMWPCVYSFIAVLISSPNCWFRFDFLWDWRCRGIVVQPLHSRSKGWGFKSQSVLHWRPLSRHLPLST